MESVEGIGTKFTFSIEFRNPEDPQGIEEQPKLEMLADIRNYETCELVGINE